MNWDTVGAGVLCLVLATGAVFAVRAGAIAQDEALQRNIKKFDCREAGITNLGRNANQKIYKCWNGSFYTAEDLARL